MTAAPVRMTVQWSVPPGEARHLTDTLHVLMQITRTEPGNAGCSVSTEMGAKVAIQYVEDWKTENDLRCHVQSDDFRNLAELMEYSTEFPVVRFFLPAGNRGLDYAEDVRRSR